MTTQRSMDTYGSDELSIPIVKLVQGVGTDYAKDALDAKPGDFYFPLTDEIIPADEGIDIIVVDMIKTRTFWGREELDEEPPECSSNDGATAVDGTECATCPHRHDAPWLLGKVERRTVCTINYNILAFQPNTGMPLMIRAHGISCQSARELLTQLRLNKALKGEYHRAPVRIMSAKKKTSAGEAFMFKFRVGDLITDKEKTEAYLVESNQLLGTVQLLPVGETLPEEGEDIEPEAAPGTPLPKEQANEFTDGQEIKVDGTVLFPPEMHFTAGGKAVIQFKIKTDKVDEVAVVAWEELAERLNKELQKGDFVTINGRVKFRSWEAADGPHSALELVAKKVTQKTDEPVAESKQKKPAPGMGKCKHGEFVLTEGCPKCVAEAAPPATEEPPAEEPPLDTDF